MTSRIQRRSAGIPSRRDEIDGVDVGAEIAEIRGDLDALASRLDALLRVCADPGFSERLRVVEGPFVGDATAAVDTTRLWLERTRVMLSPPAGTMVQAHIAAGGLAGR